MKSTMPRKGEALKIRLIKAFFFATLHSFPVFLPHLDYSICLGHKYVREYDILTRFFFFFLQLVNFFRDTWLLCRYLIPIFNLSVVSGPFPLP
jgi:hypothetical protein